MLKYLIKRVLLAFFALLAILFVSYAMLRLAPGDPTKSQLLGGDGAAAGVINTERSELAKSNLLREKLYLDRPIYIGFAHWLKNVVIHGDFGESAAVDPGRPVTRLILDRLPLTLKLNCCAILITYFLALFIGVYSAVNENKWFDICTTAMSFLLYSMPVIWVGLLLQTLFAEGGVWPFFPLKGLNVVVQADRNSSWRILAEYVRVYALPVFCLTYGGLAGLSRYARSSMLEILKSNYILSARAKGVSEERIVWVHAFRNALITLITLFAGLLPGLIAGSVLVEYIFNISGMGSLALLSLSSRDYPLQMALFAISGALTLAGILLADLLYMLADPRIKLR